jgi:bidirectional [NiFe] hydrogenase diaphorase subunit
VRVKINGKIRTAAEGDMVLDAVRGAGIEIPALCAHDDLEPYGACRLCVVEVREKGSARWRIVASCLYPVREGLEIRTHTERIKRYRAILLELMLAHSSTSGYVRELAGDHGVRRVRFAKDTDDCMLCGLCVRACSEIVGADAIGFSSRGTGRSVDIPFGIDSSRCIACGLCTYICPTDAIQMEYRRTLELRKAEDVHPCRYTMMGLVSDAVCPLNYECHRCEIDQRMWEESGTHPAFSMKAPRGKGRKRAGGTKPAPARTGSRASKGKRRKR